MKRNQQIIAFVALTAVALLVWSFEWNKHTPAMRSAASIENYKVLAVANPQIHWQELERAQKTEYKSNGRNPFSVIAPPTPKEVQDAKKKRPKPNLPRRPRKPRLLPYFRLTSSTLVTAPSPPALRAARFSPMATTSTS